MTGGSRRRHPEAERTVVRLTEPAFADLVALNRANPQALRWALKKLLLLERNPEAGAALGGPLAGFRKLTVGDRTWRIIWRVTHDASGVVIVDVAEVWAVGARSDGEVYAEMTERVARMPASPFTVALQDVVARLGRHASGGAVAQEPEADELPAWLVANLVEQAGIAEASVMEMTLREAVDRWTDWISRPRS